MRLATLVTLISLAAAATGCGVRVHYTARGYAYGYGHYYGYSTSHGSTNIVWNQAAPPPPAPNVVAMPAVGGESEVQGSDGSYGWAKTCNADVEIHRLSEQMAKKGCQFESYGYDETRAVCGGVHVLLRRDATNVYRLCPPNTDRGVCQNAWAPVIN
jgi:hypothetical protein